MTPRSVTLVGGLLAVAMLQVNLGGQGGGQTAGPAPGESLSQSYRGSQSNNVEYQKVAPFKVFDNLYYVGPGSVAVWLIPTTDGLILIDSTQEPLVDHVIDGIRSIADQYPGLEDFMIHWAEGLPPKEFKEQLTWFAKDVMPAFKKA